MKYRFTYLVVMLASVLFVVKVQAQQDPAYSMYMFDKMLINPAFTGSSNWAVGTVKSREQFMGLNGRPSTQTINFHTPIQAKHIGLGIKIVKDKIAVINNLTATGSLSYHLNFAGGKLSFGLEGGVINKKIDFNELVVTTLGDNALLSEGTRNAIAPDLSFGAYYQKKQFYMGFSNYHLLKPKFDFATASGNSKMASSMYLIVGNVFDLTKSISYEASMLMKNQASGTMQFDFNNMFYYKEKFGLGVQYRTKDAIVLLVKYNINEAFKIAYSYDITVSKFSRYSKGAHEIIISYGIKLPPPPTQKEVHPRYYF